jgi:hypothetical protein
LSDETSLARKKERLAGENRALQTLHLVEFGAAGLLLAAGALVYFTKDSSTLLVVGGIVAFLAVGHFFKVRENLREHRNVSVGRRGEMRVNQSLRAALDDNHYIFNDLMIRHGREGAQIDHLVVSPHGLFVIETKNWGGHLEGGDRDPTWTQTKDNVKHPIHLKNPILQNQRHVDVLVQRLRAAGIDWPDVISVLVFSSKYTTYDITDQSIPIMNAAGVGPYIAYYPGDRTYSGEEIDAVLNLLMKAK